MDNKVLQEMNEAREREVRGKMIKEKVDIALSLLGTRDYYRHVDTYEHIDEIKRDRLVMQTQAVDYLFDKMTRSREIRAKFQGTSRREWNWLLVFHCDDSHVYAYTPGTWESELDQLYRRVVETKRAEKRKLDIREALRAREKKLLGKGEQR